MLSWVLSIMQDRPIRDQWEYPRKMELTFSDQTKPTKKNDPYHFLSAYSPKKCFSLNKISEWNWENADFFFNSPKTRIF